MSLFVFCTCLYLRQKWVRRFGLRRTTCHPDSRTRVDLSLAWMRAKNKVCSCILGVFVCSHWLKALFTSVRAQSDRCSFIPSKSKEMPRTLKERSIPCNICHRLFTNRGGLNNHLRIHAKPNLTRQTRTPTPLSPSRSPSPNYNIFNDEFNAHPGPGSDGDDTDAPGVVEGHKTTFHPLINGACLHINVLSVHVLRCINRSAIRL